MSVHGMTLVSLRLFRKNLVNLLEFFGQMVRRPPGKKLPVRLCLFEHKTNLVSGFFCGPMFLVLVHAAKFSLLSDARKWSSGVS